MDYWKIQSVRYRRNADEMRALADRTSDMGLKKSFLELADKYDGLAQMAARAFEEDMHWRNQQIDTEAG